MADNQKVTDATYGQLGRATYLNETHEWVFTRQINETGSQDHRNPSLLAFQGFQQVSDTEQCVLGQEVQSVLYEKSQAPGQTPKLRQLRYDPQLAAASHLLSYQDLPDVHQGTNEVNSKALLAFGAAVRLGHRQADTESSVPIAAFATGPAGVILRIATIESRLTHLPSDSFGETAVRLPAISSHTFADWNGTSQSIRQIAFPTGEGATQTWLAVRKDSDTTIFHPLFHEPRPYAERGMPLRTQLDPNPILVLPMTRTGGQHHADIAFHPTDPLRFALVDVAGHWSIWKITDSRKTRGRPRFAMHLVAHGRLHPWSERYKSTSPKPHVDGWHEIRWFKVEPHSYWLVVSDRRRMSMFDPDRETSITPDLRLGTGRQEQWILDVKTLSSCGKLVVLTSNCLLWLSIGSYQGVDSRSKKIVEVDHSMRHYRAPSDTSLRLCTLEASQDQFIMISSCLNNLVTAFHCRNLPGEMKLMTASNQVSFQLRLINTELESSSQNQSTFLQLDLREVDHQMRHSDHALGRFFKLFVVSSNLSIHEILLERIVENENPLQSIQKIGLPSSRRPRKSATVILDEDLADFISDIDQIDEGAGPNSSTPPSNWPKKSQLDEARASWTVDWRDVYELITLTRGGHSEGVHEASQSRQLMFQAAVDMIRNRLSMGADAGFKVNLLWDLSLAKDSFRIEEIMEDAMILNALEKEIESSGEMRYTRLWVVSRKTSEQGYTSADDTMSDIYKHLLSDFHSPLPLDFPSRLRIAKEKIIRRVTADLALSRISVRRYTPAFETAEEGFETIPSSATALAMPQTSQSSQLIEAPSTDSSDILASAYQRLSSYTILIRDSPPTAPSSPSLAGILSHLPPPISPTNLVLPHPSTYSYTLSRQNESRNTHHQALPTPVQARASARLQRRRQHQEELFESSQRERMAPPPIAVSSQPEEPHPPHHHPDEATSHASTGGRAPPSSQLPIRHTPQKQSRSSTAAAGAAESFNSPPPSSSQTQMTPPPTTTNRANPMQSEFARMRRDTATATAGPSTPRRPGFGLGLGAGGGAASSRATGKRKAGF